MSLYDKKYIVIKNIISKDVAKLYYDYLITKSKVCSTMMENRFVNPFCKDYGWFNDNQSMGAYCIYGDPLYDNMLIQLKDKIEKEIDLELTPMYTYARIYKRGMELKRHKDRGSCAISGTINLGGDPWPIYIDTNPENGSVNDKGKYAPGGEKGEEVLLEPGDCMLYSGCECEHWRDPMLYGDICGQVFIHYMDSKDVKEGDDYDTRLGLGLPVYTKKVQNCSNTGMYKKNR